MGQEALLVPEGSATPAFVSKTVLYSEKKKKAHNAGSLSVRVVRGETRCYTGLHCTPSHSPSGRCCRVSGWAYVPRSPQRPSGHAPRSAGSALQPLLLTPWLICCNKTGCQPLPCTGKGACNKLGLALLVQTWYDPNRKLTCSRFYPALEAMMGRRQENKQAK